MFPEDKFKSYTGYDIVVFFNNYGDFINTHYPLIINYYEGVGNIDKDAFRILDELLLEANKIEGLFVANSTKLSDDTSYWELMEDFEDTLIALQTIKVTYKWTRSSYINDYDKTANMEYSLGANQTLEDVAQNLGSTDRDQDWYNIAIRNDLEETEYDETGGVKLTIPLLESIRLKPNVVIDLMSVDTILGKDLPVFTELVDDDMSVLSTDDTSIQSSEILLSLMRGSVPEFIDYGMNVFVGTNFASVQIPSLMRQLADIFRKDDTFKGIEILSIDKDQDGLRFKVSIETIKRDVIVEKEVIF